MRRHLPRRDLTTTRHREPYVIAKRLRPGDDSVLGAALADEGRLVARLDHPGIPRLLDVADAPDRPCLILECLHGQDLQEILAAVAWTRRPVPCAIAVRIATEVAAALQHAHERTGSDGRPLEIVHRDVSPSNLVVTYAGEVKLLDFGIARWTGVSRHTQVGYVKGKAPYMSPEQCAQGQIDARSDLFSLGAVIYELTTLHTPFGSALGDEDAIMQRIVDGHYPPPEALVPGYPPELSAIVARCLQPSRELRYRSGDELRRDLVAFAARSGWGPSDQDLAGWLRALFGDRNPPWLTGPTRVAALPSRARDDATGSTASVAAHRAVVIAIAFVVTLVAGLAGGLWIGAA
jgi:serine/threonine protein kinase